MITGAASGIGAAIALEAAGRRLPLALLDRDEPALARVAEEAEASGAPTAAAFPVDVTDAAALEAALRAAVDAVGVPGGAVCSAGVDQGGPSHELPVAVWDRVIAVNLRGTFLACRTLAGILLEHGRTGAIVCVSSPFASVGAPGGTAAYSASKGGVSALVRSLAVEYARAGIRFNALVPGATETPLMWASVADDERERMRAVVEGEIPLGRMADPREPARAALWLLSEEAAYMTGAALVLDGGILARSSVSV
ncbi:3-oxoacyl-[acyl-carrier protein] reductase [Conexibacter arvalis]|uniref:3-oxoacyl-[acyl-carrier protein] reductase n=1 Tax=Conexibacter arvalis TaxID=912552 RepID=A0A840IDJ7_9ACTN|nr:SDR family oxidoreductase [Conexibacter arvalis]MBB4662425.1 3-oxoacyl-[acyl-carrier protein] reductase [Conexibacter arvalis]